MRILIDTNIFINREQDQVVSQDLTLLLRTLNEIHTELVIHPLSISELRRDTDEKRKRINLSKIEAYTPLAHPPDPTHDKIFSDLIGGAKNRHDTVDNALLLAVFRNAVDFFITEDRDLHRKAKIVGLEDRVFLISEAVRYFSTLIPSKEVIHTTPSLVENSMHNLNRQDPIFDSLRVDYPEFDTWFEEKAKEGRKCFVNRRSDGSLGAVFIYKIENESIPSIPPLPKRKRLKMATMKVTHVGLKIGESILKAAVDLALKNRVLEIYLTTFPKKDHHLVDLLSEYGFEKKAIIKRVNGEENVYLKNLFPKPGDILEIKPVEISRRYYPSFYDGEKVKKFLVPIRPRYHDQLFADYPLGRKVTGSNGESGVEGNTIKKAYLTHSKITKVKPGDIILFYRSKDQQMVTSIGIVDNFFPQVSKTEEILRIIGNRSVYSRDEIEESRKPLTIILFRHHFYLKHGVSLIDLQKEKILNSAPQSIREIENRQYLWIKKHGGLDENLTFH